MLAIKNDLVQLIADLAEMSKMSYFVEHSHFGAIGRLRSADHFFSPAQYSHNKKSLLRCHSKAKFPQSEGVNCASLGTSETMAVALLLQ